MRHSQHNEAETSIVWRDEQQGRELIPVTCFNPAISLSDDVKKVSFDIDSFISEKICEFADDQTTTFREGRVYWWARGSKLVTLSQIQTKQANKIGVCQVQSDGEQDVTVPLDQLSQSISVTVRAYTKSAKNDSQIAAFKVSLHESLSKQLEPLVQAAFAGTSGALMSASKLVGEEETCLSLKLTEGATLLALAGAACSSMTPIRWWRTQKEFMNNDDGCTTSSDCWDAVKMKSRREDLYWCGIGFQRNIDHKAFTLKFKFQLNNEEPVEFEVNSETSPEGEDKMHEFDIQHYGFKPIAMKKDDTIKVGIQAIEGESDFNFGYMYSGYPYRYNNVQGQSNDFVSMYCDWNGNCTDSDSGFFPFLLYVPEGDEVITDSSEESESE